MNKKTFAIISAIILFAALSRLLPHPTNFTPVAALILFGAAYFTNKKWALIIPLTAIWLSDLLLNNIVYSTYNDGFMWFTGGFFYIYGAFALIMLLGYFLLKKVTPGRVLGGALGASVIFYLVSNFGVWLSAPVYPLTWEGLITCYTAAIPFFHYTIAGNVIYSAVLFGSFEWIRHRYPTLVPELTQV